MRVSGWIGSDPVRVICVSFGAVIRAHSSRRGGNRAEIDFTWASRYVKLDP